MKKIILFCLKIQNVYVVTDVLQCERAAVEMYMRASPLLPVFVSMIVPAVFAPEGESLQAANTTSDAAQRSIAKFSVQKGFVISKRFIIRPPSRS